MRALSVAVIACASCAVHAQKAPAPTTLKFDWGPKLEANVLAVREEVSEAGDAVRASKLEARYRMRAERTDRGYVVTFSDLQMMLDGKPVPASAEPERMAALGGLALDYDVAPNGDFVSLRNVTALQTYAERSFRAQNESLPANERPTPEQADKAMKAGASREVVELNGSRTWGALVGMWAGLPLQEGKPIQSQSPVNIPVVNVPVTLNTRTELVRRESCSSREEKLNCVRLRASSEIDPAQLAAAIERFNKTTGRATTDSGSMDVDYHYELVTDPTTLKPHHAEWSTGATVANREGGGEKVSSTQSSTVTMTFDYSPLPKQ